MTSSVLSAAQQSLWFLDELYQGDTSASEQFAIELRGPLDAQALRAAWAALLVRHAILRTTFRAGVGGATQVVATMPAVLLPLVELRDGEAALITSAERALATPFDLERGPLLRPELYRLDIDRHVLLVTAHHIVVDGLSVAPLCEELSLLYRRECEPGTPPLPPLAFQYADYAQAQIEMIDAARSADGVALDYWRRALEDPPPPLLAGLPAAHGAGSADSRAASFSVRCPIALPVAAARAVRTLARECRATPFIVLLAAWRALLFRLTDQADSIVGTPMTTRDRPELRHAIGCYVNPVALRTTLTLTDTFRQAIARERDTVLAALANGSVPFSAVVAATRPVRALGQHPIFQVLFGWEGAPGEPLEAAGVWFSRHAIAARRASYFDLELSLRDDAAYSGSLAFNPVVLGTEVGASLPERWMHWVAGLVAAPDESIIAHDVLLPAERAAVADGPEPAVPVAADDTVDALFVRQARAMPDAIAVDAADAVTTYAELDARSDRLAARLCAAGVVPGQPVGLAAGRSLELVVAWLAILRAGAICVPLDITYPPARLRYIAADAGLRVVLRGPGAPDAVVAAGVQVIDVAGSDAATASGHGPRARRRADDAAVILYTSGTTGTPKGAVTTHRSAIHRCRWMWSALGLDRDAVFALRTSPNFIDSLWEIFGPLLHGARLAIAGDEVAGDPRDLRRWLESRGATHLVLVPALLRALLDELPGSRGLPALRSVISSGEPLAPALVRRFRARLPHARLVNTYGTSEIWDAAWYDTAALPDEAARVPIGRPLPGVRCVILDASGRVRPPGVPGELAVAGIGVGPGYWRRPDLTAERYVPVAECAGAGLFYRTGDRARILSDGNIECLGRLDAQVKLRGVRIEPAEIEAALGTDAGIAAAAVAIREVGAEPRLVAWVQSRSGTHCDTLALRTRLRQLLPEIFVPTIFVPVEALAKTPSGKLDRAALVLPSAMTSGLGTAINLPRTPTERALVGIWNDVLRLAAVDTQADFFDIGGHSLLAARIVSRIRAAFGIEFTLRDIFERRSIASIAVVIEARCRPGNREEFEL